MERLRVSRHTELVEISAELRQKFRDEGVLKFPFRIDSSLVSKARGACEDELRRQGFLQGGKFSPGSLRGLPVFQQNAELARRLRPGGALSALMTEDLQKCLEDLSGGRLRPAGPEPQFLVSRPRQGESSLKELNWHLDLKIPKTDQSPGVQIFALIADVKPGGGATLALAGSHRLPYTQNPPRSALQLLRESEDAHWIFGEGRPPTPQKTITIHGQPIRLVEMSGHAGEVYVMDLRTLHSPSVNTTPTPRLMLTQRFLRTP